MWLGMNGWVKPPAIRHAAIHAGAIWLRLSAAAYNDIEDYERLAEIVARVLRDAG